MSKIRLRSDMTVKLVQHVGTDASVVAAAKVSTEGAESVRHLDGDTTSGLIRYLMRQHHGTPFEHASLTFLVEAPIFVFREWMRHRVGWSYNETSGRYRELEPVFWVPRIDRPMIPVPNYKSARPQFRTVLEWAADGGSSLADYRYRTICSTIEDAYVEAWACYQAMLNSEVALEVARAVLPVGTYSSMFATTNPRGLMSFLSLRTHEPTANHPSYPQAEIEECARKMEHLFASLFPITHAAFCEYGRESP